MTVGHTRDQLAILKRRCREVGQQDHYPRIGWPGLAVESCYTVRVDAVDMQYETRYSPLVWNAPAAL